MPCKVHQSWPRLDGTAGRFFDMDLQRKIDFAIKLLRSIPQDGPIELSYSGGKDSDVILELAKMAGIPFEAIYKNTTIDPPGTIAHAKEVGARIIQPSETFEQIIAKRGFPNRYRRFCCSLLKEYKIYDRAIQGIRRAESKKRAKRYKEPEFCRIYSAKEKARIYLPILEWTNEDVAHFIEDRKIKCAPVYYDENGKFHVERRLGCLGCPLASKRLRIAQFRKYPNMLKLYIRGGQKFMEHSEKVSLCWGGDVYKWLMFDLFSDDKTNKNVAEFKENLNGGMFPELALDAKKALEEYFGIEL